MKGGDSSSASSIIGDEEKKSRTFSDCEDCPAQEDAGSRGGASIPSRRNDAEQQDKSPSNDKKPTKNGQALDIRITTQEEEEATTEIRPTTNPSPKDPSRYQAKSSTADQDRINRKKEEMKQLITKLETIGSSAAEGGSFPSTTNPYDPVQNQEMNSSMDQKQEELNQLVTQLERIGSISDEEATAETQQCSSLSVTGSIQKRNSNNRLQRLNRKKEEMKQFVTDTTSTVGGKTTSLSVAMPEERPPRQDITNASSSRPGDNLTRTSITSRTKGNHKTAAPSKNLPLIPGPPSNLQAVTARQPELSGAASHPSDNDARPGAHPAAGRAFGDFPQWARIPNTEENTVALDAEQFTTVAAEVDLEQEITERVEEQLEERLKHYHTEASIRNNILREAPLATVVSPPSGEDGDEEEEEEEDVNSSGNNTNNQCKKRTKWWYGSLLLLLLALLAVSITWGVHRGPGGGGTGNHQDAKTFELANDTVLATVPETICYERIPFMGRSVHCPQPQELGSGVTNLIAQAYLWNFPEADISVVNAAEVKGDIVAGNLTGAMAKLLLPWPNTLVILRIKGFDLVMELERLIQVLHSQNNTPGAMYPYGAGIRYWVNMTEEFPARLSKVQVNQRLAEAEWEPIDYETTYTVVTNSYLANGGGFSQVVLASKGWNDTHVEVLPAFVKFCQEHEVLYDPPREQYSTQSYIHDPSLFDLHDGA